MTQEMTLKEISFSRNGKSILKGIDLQIKKGEILGLIGPNGAGKSTLMKLLLKILKPDKGTVYLEEENLSDWTQNKVAHRVAYLSQSPSLEASFTCREVVLMGRYARLGRFESLSAKDDKIALEAMAETETESLADRSITELSGGELQRVLLARALAQQADFLFLDEPTANLDPHYQIALLDLISSLAQKGMGVMMAIHDLNLAARYCHRLALIHQGQMVAIGDPEQVLSPKHLQSVYRIEAEIFRHPKTKRLCIVPIQIASTRNAGQSGQSGGPAGHA